MSGFKFKLGFGFGSGGVFVPPDVYSPYIDYNWTTRSPIWHSGNPLDFQGSQYIKTTNSIQSFDTGAMFFKIGQKPTAQSCVFYKSTTTNRTYLRLTPTSIIIGLADSYAFLAYDCKSEDTLCLSWDNGIWNLYANGVEVENGTYNGIVSNNVPLWIGAYSGETELADTQYDYLVHTNSSATLTQIQQSYTNPNQFYNSCAKSGGELYANTIFCTDFGGTGGYVADDRNVSVGSEDVDPLGYLVLGNWSNNNGILSTTNETNQVSQTLTNRIIGDVVLAEITISNYIAGEVSVFILGNAKEWFSKNGTYYRTMPLATSTQLAIDGRDSNPFTGSIEVSVKQLSAVYPITNYSSTMRTNFQTEKSGMQELMIERDSLGFFLGLREFPKGNGVGYGDTEWIPSADENWTIELIQVFKANGSFNLNGTAGTTGRVYIGEDGSGQATCKIGDKTKYIPSGGGLKYLVLKYNYNLSSFELLLNSISGGIVANVTFSTGTNFFTLFKESNNGFNIEEEIRLFKVHNKVLAQEEITTNYNNYVAQGLLQ